LKKNSAAPNMALAHMPATKVSPSLEVMDCTDKKNWVRSEEIGGRARRQRCPLASTKKKE